MRAGHLLTIHVVQRLSTGASREAPVDNDCFGYWACPDPLAIGLSLEYELLAAGLDI